MISTGTAAFGVYASDPQPARTALADIRALAMRFLGHATGDELADIVPTDLLATYHRASAQLPKPSLRPGYMAPGNATIAAAGITAAVTVLGAVGIPAAGAALRGFIEGSLRRGAPVTPTSISSWSRGTSPELPPVPWTPRLRWPPATGKDVRHAPTPPA